MLTPAFELNQDDEYVSICIQVPYAKIASTDVYFEDYCFTFFCKPYYLRLNLPEKVVFCPEPPVSYNFDTGAFSVRMQKLVAGQYFEDLDMLTKLLAPKGKPPVSGPLIEVIGDTSQEDENNDEDFDYLIEQTLPTNDSDSLLLESAKCGFANLYPCSVFKLKEEVSVIFDITNPSEKLPEVRVEERLAAENSKFDDDHYLADFYEDDDIKEVLNFRPDWEEVWEKMKSMKLENADDIVAFSSEEKERMRRLPNKEYLLEKSEKRVVALGVIDILFGYVYNKRTTCGENTCESGWTINKLSATLSWLETFTSVQSVVQSSVRRSLCYPIYRHWDLAMTVLQDVAKILSLGRKYILKCFLEIHEVFCNSEPRYILNDLFITDYCIWIQSRSCTTKMMLSLAEILKKAQISKGDVNLEIVELERAARLHILELVEASNSVAAEAVVAEDDRPRSLRDSAGDVNDAESLCLQLKDLKVSEKISQCATELPEGKCVDGPVIEVISSHPLQDESDSSSDCDGSSSNSCSSTSCETDSDDCSSSETDSDLESSCSDTSNECCRLLKKDQSVERLR